MARQTSKLDKLKQQLITPDRRMKMMWSSNAPWANSGYGVEMRDLLSRLLKDNWKVAQSCFHGLDIGEPIPYTKPPFDKAPLLCYPKLGRPFGSDALLYHSKHFGANIALSMQDVQALDPNHIQQLAQSGIPWIPWVPIDKEPVPAPVLHVLSFAHKIVTFSKFGQRALEKKGFSSTLILEGTDTNIFRPIDKLAARKKFGFPLDKFIVGMVGANKPDGMPRKGWEQALDAMKLFKDAHPDSLFFFQTNQGGGFPILDYAAHIGIKDSILFLDDYTALIHIGSEQMNELYNSFDFLVHPSTTEGFGLCVIEALSSGLPVIVNNCTSMPELIVEGETGEICQTASRMWIPGGGYIYFADTQSLYEKMEKLFNADRKVMGEKGRQFVLDNYSIENTAKQWSKLLEGVQTELLGSPTLQPTSNPVQLDQLNRTP